MAKREHKPEEEGDVALATRPEAERKAVPPPMFKVLLHNDHYTTMEFVVQVLEKVFHRSQAEATAIMLQVHHRGVGVAGVYPMEIAELKVQKVTDLARESEFPLLTTLEPE
jgi:ATP-dependent Clp protease adaptor protein ClpS